jgi:hypothetical protein
MAASAPAAPGSTKGKAVSLPGNWMLRYTQTGEPIYFNTVTGERYDFRSQRPPPQ